MRGLRAVWWSRDRVPLSIFFVADLYDTIGDRPLNTTLDRIDPNGHYEIGNVRWASPKEQANNRSRSPGQAPYQPMGLGSRSPRSIPANGTTLGLVSESHQQSNRSQR